MIKILSRLLLNIFTILTICAVFASSATAQFPPILSYIVDPSTQNLELFWQNQDHIPYGSIDHLKTDCQSKGKKLIFAMNGGMYNTGNAPKGLFIQKHQVLVPLDTASGDGNFYLKPNGVLYITRNRQAYIRSTPSIANAKIFDSLEFATQSGPMLIIDGSIHPAFKKGSSNLNIRNGVGLLPGNKLLFAISTQPINFYDFAAFFLHQGCQSALYLDGFVSRMYCPEKNWTQTDGNFGVIIAVTAKQ